MPAASAASALHAPPCDERLPASTSLSLAPATTRQEDPYRDRVARDSEEVDKAAWAKLLAELLAAAGMSPEQAAAPAGPVNTNWRSIRRWLSQQQGVSAKSVRDVCRALNYPVVDGLVRTGFLTAQEARLVREPTPVAPPLGGRDFLQVPCMWRCLSSDRGKPLSDARGLACSGCRTLSDPYWTPCHGLGGLL
jgi:hypothetical protein